MILLNIFLSLRDTYVLLLNFVEGFHWFIPLSSNTVLVLTGILFTPSLVNVLENTVNGVNG